MTVTAFTSPVSLTQLRSNFTDGLTNLTSDLGAGQKDFTMYVRRATLADTTDIRDRSIAFTPQDDYEVRDLSVRVTDTTASRVIESTLTVDDGETMFLVDQEVMADVTTINGTADSRPTDLDLRTTTSGRRLRCLKGVRYRLAMENTSVGTTTGIAQCMLQLRTRRRGATNGPVRLPHAFRTKENLDADKVNDNLSRLARYIKRALALRYTRSMLVYEFDGVTNASDDDLRTFRIKMPDASSNAVIEAVEAVTYGNAAVTMTVTSSDTSWPGISVETSSSATEEVYGSSGMPIAIAGTTDTTLVVAWSGAYTCTRGYLVVHLVSDRFSQGSAATEWSPTYIDATTTGLAANLTMQLDGASDAIAANLAVDKDGRCECFVTRNLAAAASVAFRCPSGARRIRRVDAYVVAAATETVTIDLQGDITAINFTVVGGGVATFATNGADAGVDATQDNDPMDSTDDLVVTISDAGAATALMVLVNVWWS